jgi:hypothetical protein
MALGRLAGRRQRRAHDPGDSGNHGERPGGVRAARGRARRARGPRAHRERQRRRRELPGGAGVVGAALASGPGNERQQFKWVAFAASLALVATIVLQVLRLSGLGLVGVVLVPAGAAVAILRYRLFEIDRVISRTVAYGLLTTMLGLVYVAGVFVFGRLLNPGGERSELAVAAATLAVAAVFQPARRRVQAAVDRRFNRARYDAARTVEAFSSRLRDEIDLDTLTAELLGVVEQTMQPTSMSLWLRPPRGQERRELLSRSGRVNLNLIRP